MAISTLRAFLSLVLAAGGTIVISCSSPPKGGGGGGDDCEEDNDCDDGEVCDDGECKKVGGVGGGGVGGGPSGPGGSGGVPSTTGTGASTSTGMPTSTSSSSMQMSSSSGPPPGCADEATFELCADCFVAMNPSGYDAFATALILSCGCTAGASCQAECDTMGVDDLCPAPGQVDLSAMNQACVDCINLLDANVDSCLMNDFPTNCQNDPDCIDFVTDLQSCPQ